MKGIRGANSIVFRLLLTIFLVFPATQLLAEKLEDLPQPTDYVSDWAHVLSADSISQIDQIAAQLDHSQAKAQLAVVTINSLDGDDAFDYATRLYSRLGLGKKGSDRGVLIFLAIQDHKRAIIVGYGLEGILPDGKTGDIGRSVVPMLRTGDYGDAALEEVNQVAQVIAADAKVTLNEEDAHRPVQRRTHQSGGAFQLIIIVFVLLFFGGSWLFRLLFGLGLVNSWRGGGWGGGPGPWMGGGGFGGGGGGGDGGGFGGFGGGDTGGGGSSGSW